VRGKLPRTDNERPISKQNACLCQVERRRARNHARAPIACYAELATRRWPCSGRHDQHVTGQALRTADPECVHRLSVEAHRESSEEEAGTRPRCLSRKGFSRRLRLLTTRVGKALHEHDIDTLPRQVLRAKKARLTGANDDAIHGGLSQLLE
jgi:hypothetical protein